MCSGLPHIQDFIGKHAAQYKGSLKVRRGRAAAQTLASTSCCCNKLNLKPQMSSHVSSVQPAIFPVACQAKRQAGSACGTNRLPPCRQQLLARHLIVQLVQLRCLCSSQCSACFSEKLRESRSCLVRHHAAASFADCAAAQAVRAVILQLLCS